MHSVAIYDFAAALLRAGMPSLSQRRRAFRAPLATWRRVLGLEGCAVQLDHALVASEIAAEVPEPLRAALREQTSAALRSGLVVQRQVATLARLAEEHGIVLLVLKGAARLLIGEPAGRRSLSDIDILVRPRDATRFHTLLQQELGYTTADAGAPHHLPGLTMRGHLGVEIHLRLGPDETPLDSTIWADARPAAAGLPTLLVPSPTALLLHTLEHAVGVNWTGRYRLRDICDAAALCTDQVSYEAVATYVRGSATRWPMETLVSAAHSLERRAPLLRTNAWRTVRRVSTARIALAVVPRERLVAERLFRYGGVLAEGSPSTIARAGLGLLRRARAALTMALVLLGSCSDATGTRSEQVPDFLYTSGGAGGAGIYLFAGDSSVRLSAAGHDDSQPHSAAGKIAFSSRRDGNREIYIADATLAGQRRLTDDPWDDAEPALSPDGDEVLFVSNRSGTPRLWVMRADGTNQRLVETGSSSFVPEGAPAWRPSGDRIAFTSTRTGTSQVFVLAVAGGTAVQVTHEATGAFVPSWSGDGKSVLYTTPEGGSAVRIVPWTGGEWRSLAAGTDPLADAVCAGSWCIAVAGEPGEGGRDIVSVSRIGRSPQPVVTGTSDHREPAFLVR